MNHRLHLTLLTLAGTMLGAGVAANAQSAPADQAPAAVAPHAHHRGMMTRALEGLNISSDQRAQIKSAREKFMTSRNSATPETRDQLKADVEAALTPAQRTQFEANVKSARAQMRAEHRAQRQQNGQPPAPAPQTT